MSYHYRAAPAVIHKNDGNENQDVTNYPYTAAKEPDGDHKGKPVGVVSYSGGEFHCRVSVGQRDFYFRALELAGLKDQVCRHFNAAKGKIRFKLDRAADLARDGERAALLKV